MSLDPNNYVRKTLGGTYFQFARLLFDIMRLDNNYNSYIESARIPGIETYQKAGSSSNVGHTIGALVGIGWETKSKGVISLANSHIREIEIIETDSLGEIISQFPLTKSPVLKKRGWLNSDYHEAKIRLKKSGFVAKKPEGIEVECYDKEFPVTETIRNDRELLDKLFQIGQTRLVIEFRNWQGAFVKFYVGEDKNDKTFNGWIQAGLNRTIPNEYLVNHYGLNVVQLLTILLDCIFGIARHLKNEYH